MLIFDICSIWGRCCFWACSWFSVRNYLSESVFHHFLNAYSSTSSCFASQVSLSNSIRGRKSSSKEQWSSVIIASFISDATLSTAVRCRHKFRILEIHCPFPFLTRNVSFRMCVTIKLSSLLIFFFILLNWWQKDCPYRIELVHWYSHIITTPERINHIIIHHTQRWKRSNKHTPQHFQLYCR